MTSTTTHVEIPTSLKAIAQLESFTHGILVLSRVLTFKLKEALRPLLVWQGVVEMPKRIMCKGMSLTVSRLTCTT